jgi:hypothetical protein
MRKCNGSSNNREQYTDAA